MREEAQRQAQARAPLNRAGAELAARLEARRAEIEHAVLTRVYALAEPGNLDPEYAEGLRAAASAAIDHSLAAIELGEERAPPPPPALLAQARLAARSGVSLDTVLRRYFAGHALLGDFLIEEAEEDGLKGAALQRLLRTQAALFDRLLAAVSEEHTREAGKRPRSSEQRHAERIERLLAGEFVDTSGLSYDFEGFHLGAIAIGSTAGSAIRDVASALDCVPLIVQCDERTAWAWLGSRRKADPETLGRVLSETWPTGLSLALGEPGKGLPGWRITHRQARAALPILMRSPDALVRYADVALLASMMQDDLLATSLRQLYLAPLERERDGGETLRETLRAYFASGCQVSSTSVALGTSRPTIAKRLNAVEERVGCSLDMCRIELEAVLRLDDLERR